MILRNLMIGFYSTFLYQKHVLDSILLYFQPPAKLRWFGSIFAISKQPPPTREKFVS